MAYYINASPSGFYFVHDDLSFDAIGGLFTVQSDAIRVRDILRAIDCDNTALYEKRESIGNRLASLRWDIREYAGQSETRVRASGLRCVADIVERRLSDVTRP